MRFLHLCLLPSGERFEERIVDTAALHQRRLDQYRRLFTSPNIARGVVSPDMPELLIQCTASREGKALGTCWLNKQILCSTIMCGTNASGRVGTARYVLRVDE